MRLKITLLILFALGLSLFSVRLSAQVPGINYTKTYATSPVYSALLGGTLIHTSGTDDAISAAIPIGFNFVYGGRQMTNIWVSSNGWLSFAAPPAGWAATSNVNSLATSPIPLLAPLWDDLKVGTSPGVVSYGLLGGSVSPNRILIIQWDSVLWAHGEDSAALCFQIKLHEEDIGSSAPSQIDFQYKRIGTAISNTAGASASIGITGFCAGDYYSLTASSVGVVNTSNLIPMIKTAEVSNFNQKIANNGIFKITPVAQTNDNCAGAQAITFDQTLPLISTLGTTIQATSSLSAAACWTGGTTVNDVWFSFTKPAGLTNFELFTDSLDCNSNGMAMEVFTGSCPVAPGGIACDENSTGGVATNTTYLNLTNQPCASTTYYVRVDQDGDSTHNGYFRLKLKPPGRDCAFANNITSCGIPYISPSLSVIGFGNEYDSTNAACHSIFQNGEDYIFSYTPVASACDNISLINTPGGSNPGLFIYLGCPTSGTCLGSVLGPGGSALTFNNFVLAAGNTYYFVVDFDTLGSQSPYLNNFNLQITAGSAGPSNDNCASAAVLTSVNGAPPCVGGTQYNNNCATPSTSGTIPLPGCGTFTDGATPDVWFTFTTPLAAGTNSQQIMVYPDALSPAQDLAMAVYTGTCAGFTLVGCDDNSNVTMPSMSVSPPAASTTYYIRVFSNDGTAPGNFRICIVYGCAPTNDICSAAVSLNVGTTVQGDNSCSTGTSEPGNPACWGAGNTLNTVWYSFVANNTTMTIGTQLLTMSNSQIALYSGCGTGLTPLFCNDDITGCSGNTLLSSQIVATGLTNGVTYYVRVDGRAGSTGTFNITVVSGNQSSLPAVLSQDCSLPTTVCNNTTFSVGGPAGLGNGNICDFGSSGTCLGSGETNSLWYTFTVDGGAAGTDLQFSINSGLLSVFNFMLWAIDTVWNNNPNHTFPTVTNYCSQLANPSAFPLTVCNSSLISLWPFTATAGMSTGVGTINMPPVAGPSVNSNTTAIITTRSPAVHIPANESVTFLLYLNNYGFLGIPFSGFTFNWQGTPISSNVPYVTWLNATSSTWNGVNNPSAWYPTCPGIPNCSTVPIPAIIAAGGIQPTVTASTSVKDLTINAGATLTISGGVTLSICGNFTNNGILSCAPTSLVRFVGSTNTTINGTFAPTGNTFYNFSIAKDISTATVTLNTDIYIQGTDSIVSGILNNNSKKTEVGWNFYNYNGSTSYTGVGNGVAGSTLTFTFRSSAAQTFTNLGATLNLNSVTMNQVAASSVTLGSGGLNDMILGTGGVLTLTQGKIITGVREVNVTNTAATACNSGIATSYVEGNLRRAIANAVTGIYEFPVGESVKGYQRFSLEYTAAPGTAYNVLGKFRQWGGAVPLPGVGPNVTECVTANYSCCAPYNNGYWTMDPSILSNLGTYTANAYPLSVTNDIGGAPNGYSIMKSPSGTNTWAMQGNCVTPSATVSPVSRTNLTSFSDFGVVQYTSPLPIQLLSFNAEPGDNGINCTWATASEINNDHFELERSTDNKGFEIIANVKGFGAGTSTQNLYYKHLDTEACPGIVYYRLKQIDIDGKSSYSNVVAVNCKDNKNVLNLYPNPANTQVNLSFYQQHEGKVKIRFIDIVGQVVIDQEQNIEKGYNYVSMNIDDLPVGVYYVSIKEGDDSENVRQVKFLKY